MKIKQGRIKNINKKIIAGVLTFTLVGVPLSGCDSLSIESINYVSSEQGETTFTADYATLEHCAFYRVYNKKLEKEYYTICLIDEYNGSYFIKTYDIFTKEELKISDGSFKSIKRVHHYLQELDMVKDLYTNEELSNLLDMFVKSYEESKQLIKK